ncbi:MAG: hypothetical protein KF819_19610 [Labilithrix sp.]|nr:hypothetical protein [Labilithrix sp.]
MDPPAPPPFNVAFAVEGDPGNPITGAIVSRNDKAVATTGPDGRATLTLEGADGETVDATVKCPEGFTSPTKPISMRLARMRDGRAPEFRVSCPPNQRKVVVAVKAENGPNLPVIYLGKVITRTDASGAAHFALEAPPGGQFQVTLDTSGDAKIKPASPSKPFTVGQHDDIFVFDQKFEVEKKKVVHHKVKLPTCLGCKA